MHLRMYDPSDDIVPGRYVFFDDRRGPFVAFAHNPGAGEVCRAAGYHTDESAEHLELKHQLATAARLKGWEAEDEVYHTLPDGAGCRADVVIRHRDHKPRVLEAQLSPLGTDEALRRTELYQQAFGSTLWTHTKARPWAKQVPTLRVDEDDHGTVIGGVYLDQEGRRRLDPTPLLDVVPRVLPPNREFMFITDFGEFLPVGGDPVRRPKRRPTRRQREPGETVVGRNVRECVDLDDTDVRIGDPRYFAPDGTPWCHFGRGLHCLNGDDCLNLNHRGRTP